ncbi:MAG TPA: hypothetical protein VFW16_08385 [Streptosporangiaceae bacterium]|nr:hypothetical protein [Streptosporangiaceae bacterium]
MFPSQINQMARQHANELRERPATARPAPRRRGEAGAIRQHTGWTLVQIGLRIAASATR